MRLAIGRNKFRLGTELAILNKTGAADFLGGNNQKGLDTVEQQWLVQQINQHIEELSGHEVDFDAMPRPSYPQVYNDAEQEFLMSGSDDSSLDDPRSKL
ncbi:MAG: hypothetical protein WDW38_004177 [Sanguina aurantia]